jgi:hypothetical protein
LGDLKNARDFFCPNQGEIVRGELAENGWGAAVADSGSRQNDVGSHGDLGDVQDSVNERRCEFITWEHDLDDTRILNQHGRGREHRNANPLSWYELLFCVLDRLRNNRCDNGRPNQKRNDVCND